MENYNFINPEEEKIKLSSVQKIGRIAGKLNDLQSRPDYRLKTSVSKKSPAPQAFGETFNQYSSEIEQHGHVVSPVDKSYEENPAAKSDEEARKQAYLKNRYRH